MCGSAKPALKTYSVSSQFILVLTFSILAIVIILASIGGIAFTIAYGVGSGNVINTTFSTISQTITTFTNSAKDIVNGVNIVQKFSDSVNKLFKDSIFPLVNQTTSLGNFYMGIPLNLLQVQLNDLDSTILKLQDLNKLEKEIFTNNRDILDNMNYYPASQLDSMVTTTQRASFPQQTCTNLNTSFNTLYSNVVKRIPC